MHAGEALTSPFSLPGSTVFTEYPETVLHPTTASQVTPGLSQCREPKCGSPLGQQLHYFPSRTGPASGGKEKENIRLMLVLLHFYNEFHFSVIKCKPALFPRVVLAVSILNILF